MHILYDGLHDHTLMYTNLLSRILSYVFHFGGSYSHKIPHQSMLSRSPIDVNMLQPRQLLAAKLLEPSTGNRNPCHRHFLVFKTLVSLVDHFQIGSSAVRQLGKKRIWSYTFRCNFFQWSQWSPTNVIVLLVTRGGASLLNFLSFTF